MKFSPISIYDVAAQQAWMEDEAAKGRFLSSHSTVFSRFDKAEPKAVRYRMEPLTRKESFPDVRRREVYREMGWNYVCTAGQAFHIWRADDPAVPELHTEPEMQGEAYTYLVGKLRILEWVCAAVLLIPVVLAAVFHLTLGGAYRDNLLWSWRPLWEVAILWLAMLFCVVQSLYWTLSLRRYIRRLKAGIPQPQRNTYMWKQVLCAVTLAVYVLWIVSRFAVLCRPNSIPFEPAESFEEPVPYVALAEGEDVKAIRWKNWRTAEQWWILQGDGGGYTRYYRFCLAASAKHRVKIIIKDKNLTQIENDGLDGVWWVEDTGNGYRQLLIWQGKQIVEIFYEGPDLPVGYLEECAELLVNHVA